MNRTGLPAVAALVACVAVSAATFAAGADDPSDDEAARRLQFMVARMREYRVHPTDRPDSPCELTEAPLLRWNNPVSGAVDGAVFVWTDGTRPAVLAKVHINEPKAAWGEAVHSLAADPLVVTSRGQEIWSPSGRGLTFETLDGPAPAATERARLLQMRALARRVRASGHWGEENPGEWDLRLLAEPLLRYADPERDVLDAAVFALAQGTNPEALLVIEAAGDADTAEWRVSATRLTKYGVRVELDDRVLADLPREETFPADAPFRHGWHKFSRYPFGGDGD